MLLLNLTLDFNVYTADSTFSLNILHCNISFEFPDLLAKDIGTGVFLLDGDVSLLICYFTITLTNVIIS